LFPLTQLAIPLSKLHALYNSCLEAHVTNPNSNDYKLTTIVLDIAGHSLFKHVGIKKDEIEKHSFLKLSFAYKGLDAINLSNILHHKSVKYKISPYFKDQSEPIISYAFTIHIATKIFNYKHVLHDLNIEDFKYKLLNYTHASSPFINNPAGQVLSDDLDIINHTSLRDVFAKGPKYREPKSINRKHNFKIGKT